MLDFLLQIIAFAAVLVGIRGRGWDHDATGFRRLTTQGRIAVLLAAATLFASGTKTYLELQAKARQEVDAVARYNEAAKQLHRAVDGLLVAVRIAVHDVRGGAGELPLSELQGAPVIELLEKYDTMRDRSQFIPDAASASGPIGYYFADRADKAADAFRSSLFALAWAVPPCLLQQLGAIQQPDVLGWVKPHMDLVKPLKLNSVLMLDGESSAEMYRRAIELIIASDRILLKTVTSMKELEHLCESSSGK